MGMRAAYWVVYVAPIIAIGLIWRSYDTMGPKLWWITILIFGLIFLSRPASASLSVVILLLHVFVAYFREERLEKRKKEQLLEKVLEAQRGNLG